MTNIKTFRQLSIDDTLYVVDSNTCSLCEYKDYSIYNNGKDMMDLDVCDDYQRITFNMVSKDSNKRTVFYGGKDVTLHADYNEAIKELEQIQIKHYIYEIRSIHSEVNRLTAELSDKQSIYNSLTNVLTELNESFINLTQTITNEHKQ